MSWVKEAREGLARGEAVTVRPHGGSMRGRIESGQEVTLIPATIGDVAVDDVVFVRWKGNYLLHLAKQVERDRVLIGNNVGKINGWVSESDVLGKLAPSTSPDLEVLWHDEAGRDFLADLRSFCQSMDCWQATFNLEEEPGKRLYVDGRNVRLLSMEAPAPSAAFRCPHCGAADFNVVKGELEGKLVLGLACISCDTYGLIAPKGL